MHKPPILWFVIPCYNEEAVLPITAPLFLDKLTTLIAAAHIAPESRILLVNDGSKDDTWGYIQQLAAHDAHFIGIAQSRNRGHQNALLAGLMEAKDHCDITISIDCDGQDDLSAADQMIAAYTDDGCDVVYGVRDGRRSDSLFKRSTAEGFYKLLNWMGAEVVFNHADYRLISAVALNSLADFNEVNIFLRGMVPLIGYKSTSVPYTRTARLAGESHYPLHKMLALAFDGITSLSIRPIRIIATLGALLSALSFLGVLWVFYEVAIGNVITGWASTVAIVCFLSGIQLLSLGVIGEYIGKIYMEVKARPRYIISDKTNNFKE